MKILFLTLSQAISNINNRGIYPDLLRHFAKKGHKVYIVCPSERRLKKKTEIKTEGNVTTLNVRTLNITKSNVVEKGIGTILIEYQFGEAIKKYLADVNFDLILYSTPPITFNKIIRTLKAKHAAKTYLLLKDIFPQNAVDLRILSKWNPLYWFFREKEKRLYALSDWIGCMSPANVEYVLKHNPSVPLSKVEVCPNSIELSLDNSIQTNGVIIRQKYGLPEDRIVLVYGGNLGKPQGIGFLIKVLKSNVERKDIFFVIAGDGTEFFRLKMYIEAKKLTNVLLIKALPKKDFDELISACNIGLIFLDSRFTIPNYPSRLLTYLENRIPVLMAIDENTDVGKIATKNGYGRCVKSENLSAFNNNLDIFVKNPVACKKMGELGYNFLLRNYTVEYSYNTIISHMS